MGGQLATSKMGKVLWCIFNDTCKAVMTRIIPARFESLGTLKRNSSFPTEPQKHYCCIMYTLLQLMIAFVYRESCVVGHVKKNLPVPALKYPHLTCLHSKVGECVLSVSLIIAPMMIPHRPVLK